MLVYNSSFSLWVSLAATAGAPTVDEIERREMLQNSEDGKESDFHERCGVRGRHPGRQRRKEGAMIVYQEKKCQSQKKSSLARGPEMLEASREAGGTYSNKGRCIIQAARNDEETNSCLTTRG